jgi:hypothetical protein
MPKIPIEEIQAAFPEWEREFPPILDLEQAATLARCAPSTLKGWFSQGRFPRCANRGKPLLIWRNRFVSELMSMDSRRPRRSCPPLDRP